MDERDAGDEDTRDDGSLCPFCGEELGRFRRVWSTPLWPRMEMSFRDAMQAPLVNEKLCCEIIHTCVGDCADQARAFAAEQRRRPEEKRMRALRRAAGLHP